MSSTFAADGAPPERLPRCHACVALAIGVAASVLWSFLYLEVDYRQLFSSESIGLMAKFVREFFPPDASPAFVAKAAWGALQTFAVAAITPSASAMQPQHGGRRVGAGAAAVSIALTTGRAG